jgi:RNA polymerase nonessential primary-like sigma factor
MCELTEIDLEEEGEETFDLDIQPPFRDDGDDTEFFDTLTTSKKKKGVKNATGTGMQQFLATAHKIPLLTEKQEKYFGSLALHGNKKAIDMLVKSNILLVASGAHKYEGRGLDFDDLVQEGIFGLYKAAKKFDPDRGFRFSTYATWWINQKMERAPKELGRSVRLPVHKYDEIKTVCGAEKVLSVDGSVVSDHQIAVSIGKTDKWVRKVQGLRCPPYSLDVPTHTDSPEPSKVNFKDVLVDESDNDPASFAHDDSVVTALELLLKKLTPIQRDVICRRHGIHGFEEQTLEAIGMLHGLTRERIRQIESAALKKMHKRAEILGMTLGDHFDAK